MSDPFTHVPALRGRIKPAEQSTLRVTSEVLCEWDARARELGRADDWRMPDAQRESTRYKVLGSFAPAQEIWIFGYGSLMWDPGIHFSEVRLADVAGYQRRFTYKITVGRGSPEKPALMLSLERGAGHCRGLAFRIDADMADAESCILWRREMLRGGYTPVMLPMRTPQGSITALAFTSNPAHPEYSGELPLAQSAALIASGTGTLGPNRDYLDHLAAQLEALQIEDDYVDTLHRRVRQMDDASAR